MFLFRTCKRGTKYCGWHREMPPFNFWRHICITYDHFRDSYKLYVDGVKVESGAFAGDNSVEPIRPGGIFVVGQDQVRGLRSEWRVTPCTLRMSWTEATTRSSPGPV